MILRDRDDNSAWNSAGDGTLERRDYYCQNWHADVAALISDTGKMVEWGQYPGAYGLEFGLPGTDVDADGDVDAADGTQYTAWIGISAYRVRADWDLDNDVDAFDSAERSARNGLTQGLGALSYVKSTRSVAGYVNDRVVPVKHIRHRVLHNELGRWVQRDPAGYVDGTSLYAYGNNSPILDNDPSGLQCSSCTSINATRANALQTVPPTTPPTLSCAGAPCEHDLGQVVGLPPGITWVGPIVSVPAGCLCCAGSGGVSPALVPIGPGTGNAINAAALAACRGIAPTATCGIGCSCYANPAQTPRTRVVPCTRTITLRWTCTDPGSSSIVIPIVPGPFGLPWIGAPTVVTTPPTVCACSQSVGITTSVTLTYRRGTCFDIADLSTPIPPGWVPTPPYIASGEPSNAFETAT